MKMQSIVLLFLFNFYLENILNASNVESNHVICSLQISSKKNNKFKKSNNRIHEATEEITDYYKKQYVDGINENHHYPRKKNTVFFVNFDHAFNSWTLYKPSYIPYDEFTKFIKKIYKKHGLQVICHKDQLVTVTNSEGFENNYLSLDEFEMYKNMTEDDFKKKIKELENNNDADGANSLKNIQEMQKFFFWHLQIPTTGLLTGGDFDIDDQYKPLAWHFLLWDLAPKKGEGAHVAIIDTGASAFNPQEKEFSKLYKKNINITAPDNLQEYGYNLVSENGLDPIRQITIEFGRYCDQAKFNSEEFIKELPEWIIDLIKNKNQIQIEQYFTKHAKKCYLDASFKKLNKKGDDILKDLLYGEEGIIPSENNSFFHIVNLQDPYNTEVLLETLPAPKIDTIGSQFAAGHGTFTQGVVNAKINNGRGISGLAPQASVTMIKAFKDGGTTNKSTLNAGLQRAIALKNNIVSMSLKITDEIDKVADAPLKELIDSIDYVVAASGNDGGKLSKLAYPAKFDSVAFDVGAFGYDDGQYSICPFTQKEINIGPKFAAPGKDIFSSGLTPEQTEDSMYIFMSGTSIAVPVITGFIALVTAEFQDVFTREEILKVIYTFSIKMNSQDNWQKDIKLGTPDMRSALLCLHVLKDLRQKIKDKPELKYYSFSKNFDNLVQAIYTINYYVPTCYEKEIGISCTKNFAGYSKAVQSQQPQININSFFLKNDKKLSDIINYISELIIYTINPKKIDSMIKDTPQSLLDDLQLIIPKQNVILPNKKFKLFANLPTTSQNRINGALATRSSCIITEA